MKKSETAVLSLSKLGLLASLIFILLFSCDNLLKQTVIEDLTLEPPAMELIGANFDEEAQCYRSGFSVELSSNQRGVNIHYRLSMVGGTVQEGIYNGTPLLVGTHGKTFEFTAWCEAPQTLQSQNVGGRYYFEYQGLTAPLAAIEEVYLKTIDEGSNQLNRDSLISLENHPSSQGAQIYYTIPGHPEFPDNLYKLYEAPFLLEGNSSDQGINYTLLTHASLLGQVDTNGDGQLEDVELVPSSPDRAFGIRIRYPLAAPPEYSQPTRPEGFSAPFSLTLSHPVEGAVLHYSLDGSDPDPAKGGTLYEQGTQLPIGSNGEGTQLRVHVTSPGCRSREFVQEYWINPELCPDPVITLSPDLANNRIARSAVITGDNTVADSSLNSQVRSLVINRHFDLELSTAEMPQDGKIFYTLIDATNPQLPLFEQDAQGQYQAVGLNGTREYNGPIAVDNGDWDWTTGTSLWLCTQVVAPDRTASPPQYTRISLKYLDMPEPVFRWADADTGDSGNLTSDGTVNMSNIQRLEIYAGLDNVESYLWDGLEYSYERRRLTNEPHSENSQNWNRTARIDFHETESGEDIVYSYNFTFKQDQRIDRYVSLEIRIDRELPSMPDLKMNTPTSDLIVGSDGKYYINKNIMESAGIAPLVHFENPSPGENRIFTLDGSTQQITGDIVVNLKDFQDLTSDGEYRLQARTVDQAGNVSNGFATFEFVVDTVAPEGDHTVYPYYVSEYNCGFQVKYNSTDTDIHQVGLSYNNNLYLGENNGREMEYPDIDGLPFQYGQEIENLGICYQDMAGNLRTYAIEKIYAGYLIASPNGLPGNRGTQDSPLDIGTALEVAAGSHTNGIWPGDSFGGLYLLEGEYKDGNGAPIPFPTGSYNFSIRGGYRVEGDGSLAPPHLVDFDNTGLNNLSIFSGYSGSGSLIVIDNPSSSITLSNLVFQNVQQGVLRAGAMTSQNLTIKNCSFKSLGNKIGNSFYLYDVDDIIISNSEFENFYGEHVNSNSGPILIQRSNLTQIMDSSFRNNKSDQFGTIHFGSIQEIKIINSTFSGNTSQKGGGLYINDTSSSIVLSNNTFLANTSQTRGGAVYLNYNTATTRLSHNVFVNNNSLGDASTGGGGAIYFSKGEGQITRTNYLISIGNRYRDNTSTFHASTLYAEAIQAYFFSDAFEGNFSSNSMITLAGLVNEVFVVNSNFSGNYGGSTTNSSSQLRVEIDDSFPVYLFNNFFHHEDLVADWNAVRYNANGPSNIMYFPKNNVFIDSTAATMNGNDFSDDPLWENHILRPGQGEIYPEFSQLYNAGNLYIDLHDEMATSHPNPIRQALDLDFNGNENGIDWSNFKIFRYSTMYIDPEKSTFIPPTQHNRLNWDLDIGAYEY